MSDEFEAGESSNLSWARYDEVTRILAIDFKGKDGRKTSTYEYQNFPASQWEAFKASSSKGQYFATMIRPFHVGKKLPIAGSGMLDLSEPAP